MGFYNQLMGTLPEGAFSSNDPKNVGQMKEKIPSGYRKFQLQNYTPEQMDLFSQLFSNVGPESYLSKLASGDQSQFAEMEAPALRQFNQLQGSLASRFSGMGMGGRKSSGFQNASNAAAQDFASQLQSNRQNLQRQAIMDLMGMSEGLLNQRPYETGLSQKRPHQNSALEFLGSMGGALPGFFTGGSEGAMQGGKMAFNALSGF